MTDFDISFDSQLSVINGVNRLPWVGTSFNAGGSRMLILGESAYDWYTKDGSSIERISEPNNLRELHIKHAFNFKKESKFVRNVERAIFGKKTPSDYEKKTLWTSVSYHNLVSRILISNEKRPSYKDYFDGWATFDQILDVLKPSQVIVYGLERSKINSLVEYYSNKDAQIRVEKRPEKIARSHPKVATIEKNGSSVRLLFIRHPSSYFSWKKWHKAISAEFPNLASGV